MIAEETEAKGIFVLSLPDEELARLAAGGRLDCFEELLARYRDRVYRICYRCAGNADDAEDWAQECFVRTFRQLGHFDPSLPFAPWLLRLVANTCINLAKARARHAEPCEPNFLAELAGADWEPDPLQKLVAGEEESVVLGAIAVCRPRCGLPSPCAWWMSFRFVSCPKCWVYRCKRQPHACVAHWSKFDRPLFVRTMLLRVLRGVRQRSGESTEEE